ncbi:MAG: hypothetical protein ACNA8R_05270 [Nitriliruptoraceae bacterium]
MPRVPVHTVADDTWSAALEAGWTERELLEGYAELDLPAAPKLD